MDYRKFRAQFKKMFNRFTKLEDLSVKIVGNTTEVSFVGTYKSKAREYEIGSGDLDYDKAHSKVSGKVKISVNTGNLDSLFITETISDLARGNR